MEPSGGVGKAAAELIKEMQQAQQELEQAQNKSSSTAFTTNHSVPVASANSTAASWAASGVLATRPS